ncbi:hypothetical protein HK100_010284, partial [Physocladia obscura]
MLSNFLSRRKSVKLEKTKSKGAKEKEAAADLRADSGTPQPGEGGNTTSPRRSSVISAMNFRSPSRGSLRHSTATLERDTPLSPT